MNWKLPPVEKVYEAFSVLADERFDMKEQGKAYVKSSTGEKIYNVTWTDNGDGALKVYSNDNASKWQGYTGYPIIAMLMYTGRIQFNKDIIPYFKNIEWNRLNKIYKNNYAQAVDFILNNIDKTESTIIKLEADSVFRQLSALQLIR